MAIRKKETKEVKMLDEYIVKDLEKTKQYRTVDQQQAAKTRILNSLRKAGWPIDAAGFIAKYEAEKGALLKIDGIGPIYEVILVDVANLIYKDLKKKTKPKEKPVAKTKKK